MTKRKTNPNPSRIQEMIRSGQLKVREGRSYSEIKEQRVHEGLKLDETPAYLRSDDDFRTRKRKSVTLSPQAIAIARKIGNRNVSQGIERALMHWFDCPRTDRRRTKASNGDET